MLSILIPVYNYDVLPLVEEVHKQAIECNIEFEIIVIDDASPNPTFNTEKLKSFSKTFLHLLDKNIGRSAIRNLLAEKAKFENLLFIDAGTFPKPKHFIASYIDQIGKDVIIGSIAAEENKPERKYLLRWLYTKTKEASKGAGKKLTSGNFLIKKAIIDKFPFDERLKSYGYEDYLFFSNLKANSVKLDFIDNPIIHDCKEETAEFINKTEEALQNLHMLYTNEYALVKDNKIIRTYSKLKRVGFHKLMVVFFKVFKASIVKNLNSSRPSIFLFDLYKLGYFCSIK